MSLFELARTILQIFGLFFLVSQTYLIHRETRRIVGRNAYPLAVWAFAWGVLLGLFVGGI